MYLFCFKCFITHVLSKSPLRGKCRNIIDLFFNSMYIKDQWLHKICNFAIFVTFDENHFHTFSQTFTMCSFILVGAMITSLLTDFYFNSLHSDIDIHILFTALSTFPWVLTRRITFYNQELLKLAIISKLFLWPLHAHLNQGWYCVEKLDANHSWEIKRVKIDSTQD